jgi:hypothetical protein
MGFAADVSPELKMNHLISTKRANLHYVKRLIFGTSASYVPAIIQSFPNTNYLYKVPSKVK